MKIAAVICEFNPFHNGHAHLLSSLRSEYGADYIIAVMSGNYVQRGEPAIFDKTLRTAAALTGDPASGGFADLVIELPTLFSTAAAGEFAFAGVKAALSTGIVNMLGFGVEDGVSLSLLTEQAERLENEDEAVSCRIRELMRGGSSYPAAVASALDTHSCRNTQALYSSNNILAAEYLKALNIQDPGRTVMPAPVSRIGDSYSMTLANDDHYCSASYLRRVITEADLAAQDFNGLLERYVPSAAAKTYSGNRIVTPDDFSMLLSRAVLDARYLDTDLRLYSGVSSGIANRLVNRADRSMTFTERVSDTKTRQYTYTRISRALLSIALGITADEKASAKSEGWITYLHILGFRSSSSQLLKMLKQNAAVPVITKTADHRELLKEEIRFSNLYYSAALSPNEFERSPVIV